MVATTVGTMVVTMVLTMVAAWFGCDVVPQDPTALAAFSVFESSKDVSQLVETVKIILEG